MVKQRVKAIISDYDGTLVPIAHVKDTSTNAILTELEDILGDISAEIPVSVISTKDIEFLAKKVTFARVISCIGGIETLVLTTHAFSRIIEKRILHADLVALQMNSKVLEAVAEGIFSCKDFSDMLIERKHPSDDWSYYRRGTTHFISSIVANLKKPPVPVYIYVRKYSMHPFVDIYSTECNKGMAFDTIIAELAYASANGKGTLYLGDSENDNPAFRKAGVSLGIRSDARVNPKLDCSYFLNYGQLSSFLKKLRNNDYLFSEELLREANAYDQAQNGMGQ